MELVAQYHARCGEGPLFDADRGVVFWVDIDTGRLFQIDTTTRAHKVIHQGEPIGGFTLQKTGELLLFRVNDVVELVPETGALRKVIDFKDDGVPRFNDTSAGPNGECYAGTMGHTKTSGGLFRLHKDRRLELLFRGTNCSNGMAWSPDRRTMYYTNTTTATITAFDYDETTGDLTNGRVLIQADPATEGNPDGLTIDSEGNLYSARWGGSAIYTYYPDGRPRSRIPVPTPNVTSMCFAGPDHKDLYITSAAKGTEDPNGGGLWVYRSDVAGLPEFKSEITVG